MLRFYPVKFKYIVLCMIRPTTVTTSFLFSSAGNLIHANRLLKDVLKDLNY